MRCRSAIQAGDVNLFLVQYLVSIWDGDETVPVPMVSVLEPIRVEWKRLLGGGYRDVLTKSFLEALSSRWFYLVNHYGLPISQAILQKISLACQDELD